ncbi:uncharacterized protein EI97DRAFT_449623 [Westerdykella ornata]|uniref:Galactosyl transferase GMA12/MNN10 family protein n=1 Tax=Westerdykella ornata TaxID=318751 RepID=A0A6A6JNR0_WESOR|nr:uncharacterized protein EI97DRAFT_449623 [Westerdykella ornata]KAF2277528.1 hypothetical protein EI97DRAFT_449623 [Westerdykella ornata]
MISRLLRASPTALLLVLFCMLFGWQLILGGDREHALLQNSLIVSPEEAAAATSPSVQVPRRLRIAVITAVTEERSYIHLSLKNKDHYCRRHNYTFIVDFEQHSPYGVWWWKYNMVQRLAKTGEYDWIWWVDIDTLFTNTDIKVHEIIEDNLKRAPNPDDIDLLVTHDCNGLNTGSFLVRGHKRSLDLFQAIDEVRASVAEKEHDNILEQDAMGRLLKSNPEAAAKSLRLPSYLMNAYPPEIRCYEDKTVTDISAEWKPGYFYIHFAGAGIVVGGHDAVGRLMRKYEQYVIWGDWRTFYENYER